MTISYKKDSVKQEKRFAAGLGGRTTPMSGAGLRKGDVHTADVILEAKIAPSKQGLSITFKIETFKKTIQEALTHHKIPLWGFTLGGRDFVILRREDYQEMRGER